MSDIIKQQVLLDINEVAIPFLEEHGFVNDVAVMRAYETLIKSAKHYSLPEGGRLMEITDFRVPFKNGFVLPEKSITIDYSDGEEDKRFVLCVSIGLEECRNLVHDESIVARIIDSGADHLTIIVQFICDDDVYVCNPMAAILSNKCISESMEEIEFMPFPMLAGYMNLLSEDSRDSHYECCSDVTEEVFVAYELGIALSCHNVKEINGSSRKGFVRSVDGVNTWYDDIVNLSSAVN